MSVSHAYDPAGRETLLGNFAPSGAALALFSSTYDPANNRLTVLEVDGSRTTYSYDPAYQLISEQRSGSNPFTASALYDPLGNRLVASLSGVVYTSTYNAANELVLLTPASGAPTTSSYDANGNLTLENTGGALTSYSWDFENRLIGVAYPTGQRQTFGYAGSGQRTQVNSPSSGLTHQLWDGENVLLTTDVNLVTQAHYTDNPGYWGGLVSQNQLGVSSFYGFDGPGNTRILVSGAGSVLAAYLYEAFGLELLSPSASNVYLFGGQYGYQRDWPNRYDVRARVLEVANGRWISRDPIGFGGGDWNLYRFVGNNPLVNIDASGLASDPDTPGCQSTDCSCCGDSLPGSHCGKVKSQATACINNALAKYCTSGCFDAHMILCQLFAESGDDCTLPINPTKGKNGEYNYGWMQMSESIWKDNCKNLGKVGKPTFTKCWNDLCCSITCAIKTMCSNKQYPCKQCAETGWGTECKGNDKMCCCLRCVDFGGKYDPNKKVY